jgi:hypothetical protein
VITNQALTNQSKSDSEQRPTRKLNRRTALIGGAWAALLSSSLAPAGRVLAQGIAVPHDPFILLLKGVYQPVAHAKNLGLSAVHLDDGSYSQTQIYPVFGIADSKNPDKAIGTFYVQFAGTLCAYDLPGGAIAMSFNPVPRGAPAGYNGFVPFPDGRGGKYMEGTFELKILQANGIFRAFAGGHNHMVDRLHQLANGKFDEFCFCNISQYRFP